MGDIHKRNTRCFKSQGPRGRVKGMTDIALRENLFFFCRKQFLLPNSRTILDFSVCVKVTYLIFGIELTIEGIDCAYKENFDCKTVTC